MNKETLMYFCSIMKSLFVLSLIMIAISGCSSHKSMIASDVVIYDNDSVTTKAEFPGGYAVYRSFFANNYSVKAFMPRQTAEGLGIYSFVVDTLGNINDIKAVQPISTETDLAMFNLIKKMPNWKPATLDGKPVCVQVKLYQNFKDPRAEYDIAPYFPGGVEAMQAHLTGYLEKEHGYVYVKCIIDETGKVKEPEILGGGMMGYHAAQMAKSIVRSMPRWRPAIKDGKPMRSERIVSVHFPEH